MHVHYGWIRQAGSEIWPMFVGTLLAGLLIFALYQTIISAGWAAGEGVLALLVLVLAFGVLAPSRSGAFLAVFLGPFLIVARCGTGDAGPCGSEIGFPGYLLVAWILVILPLLLSIGLGWALGIRWRGGSLVTHWSRPDTTPSTEARDERV